MQEFSSGHYAGYVETNDALITGVRGIARRLSFFVHTPFDKLKANGLLNFTGLLGRMNKTLFLSPTASLVSRHEVAIMYFGRTSEFLMMTSGTHGDPLRALYARAVAVQLVQARRPLGG